MNGRRYLLSLLLIALVLIWVRPLGVTAAPLSREQLMEMQQARRNQSMPNLEISDQRSLPGMSVANGQALSLSPQSGVDNAGRAAEWTGQAGRDEQFQREATGQLPPGTGNVSFGHSTYQNQQAEMTEAFRSLNQYMQQSPTERARQQQEFERELNQALEQMARESSVAAGFLPKDAQTYQNEQAEMMEMFSSLNLSIQQTSRSERERQQHEFERELNQALEQMARESSDAGKVPERDAEEMMRSALEVMQGLHNSLKEARTANPGQPVRP